MARRLASGSVNGRRRLGETISEGEGISLLVLAGEAVDVVAAEAAGAACIVAPPGAEVDVATTTTLPVLARGMSSRQAADAGAEAWVLVAEEHGDDLAEGYTSARQAGLECVVDVQDEEELERVLQESDAEIILLSPRQADEEEDAVDRILELLPDVPAGMLVVAELLAPTGAELLALERAGIDAVLVDVRSLAGLESGRPSAP